MDTIKPKLTYILFYNGFIIEDIVSKLLSKQQLNQEKIVFHLQNILQCKTYINFMSYKQLKYLIYKAL